MLYVLVYSYHGARGWDWKGVMEGRKGMEGRDGEVFCVVLRCIDGLMDGWMDGWIHSCTE